MKASRFALLSKILILLALIASTAAPPTAAAQPEVTFSVNSITDVVDALPGDGICESATGNGMCTLRAAVMEANARIGGDTISLPAGTYHLTIVGADEELGASGDLDVTDTLTISGAGSVTTIIDADGLGDRVFDVKSTAGRLSLYYLKIQNGSTNGAGGGIRANAELVLTEVVLQGNAADANGGAISTTSPLYMTGGAVNANTAGYSGGGINSGHALSLDQVSFSNNSSTDDGGSIRLAATANGFITGSSLHAGTAGNNGGHIFNAGTLEIRNSTIDKGIASSSGGGIYNDEAGQLTLSQVIFNDNNAVVYGGAIANNLAGAVEGESLTLNNNSANLGGAVGASAGTFSMSHSTASYNDAVKGGAFYVTNGWVQLRESTIISNTATAGGGIFGDTGSVVDLERVLVRANHSESSGGGIVISFGIGNIMNSTISRNTADNSGGGVYSEGDTAFANSTISDNIASLSGSGTGGGVYNSVEIFIQNTIIYGNLIKFQMFFMESDCSGTLITVHYNLIGTLTSCTLDGSEGLDLIDVDPLLGTLQDNGGSTDTYALLDGSPAIDAANPDGCENFTGLPLQIDQRNLPRHWDGNGDGEYRCDIGAFEYPVTLNNLYLPVTRR